MPGDAAVGLGEVVSRYEAHGPLVAAFLANLLATFGDKGQLVVVTLASRYDAGRVFAGAMAAFGVWSALEVALGAWLVLVVPAGAMTAATGGLFLLFGVWTLRGVAPKFGRCAAGRDSAQASTRGPPGGASAGAAVAHLPAGLPLASYGGVATSFVLVLFAEFGDKTQLLTINLASAFPSSPASVFVGVVAALGLRTGVDAVVGEQAERWLPARYVELSAAVVFAAFGLLVLGVLPALGLVAVVVGCVGLCVVGALRDAGRI